MDRTTIKTVSKVLLIDPSKCDGCKECEKVCTVRHTGYRKTARKRIEVMGTDSGDKSFFVPFACQQCADAPCMAVCPKQAITRDIGLARIVVDASLCVGCAMCVSACPSGLMAFDYECGLAYKCDLCDGEPQCVRVCEKKAIVYIEPHRLQQERAQKEAARLCGALRADVSFQAR